MLSYATRLNSEIAQRDGKLLMYIRTHQPDIHDHEPLDNSLGKETSIVKSFFRSLRFLTIVALSRSVSSSILSILWVYIPSCESCQASKVWCKGPCARVRVQGEVRCDLYIVSWSTVRQTTALNDNDVVEVRQW